MDYPVKTLQQLRPLLVGFRKAAGLTQAQLAARLGVTQQTYAQLEAKPESASFDRLYPVLKLLDVNLVLAQVPGSTTVEGDVATRVKSAKGAAPEKPPAATKRGVEAGTPRSGAKRAAGRVNAPPKARDREPVAIEPVIKRRENW
ncbi:transcriptional regulator [Trinickia dabaoshanensis]|uniref:Transcriptional regulator n=1 Tax=Trinickia dabaoshanensis TaxID=564714 RepID=A0A2N7VEU8_9BURK|nr:helix-turn-helix transcriptional regulator [Trinickia dabaoshanensis]PMS15671.1 transcriptional regulator [Trinickia dabaoshanensis]